jgi:hypothetical protein
VTVPVPVSATAADPLTREAAGLIGKALWPDVGELQPQLQPEAGI